MGGGGGTGDPYQLDAPRYRTDKRRTAKKYVTPFVLFKEDQSCTTFV